MPQSEYMGFKFYERELPPNSLAAFTLNGEVVGVITNTGILAEIETLTENRD